MSESVSKSINRREAGWVQHQTEMVELGTNNVIAELQHIASLNVDQLNDIFFDRQLRIGHAGDINQMVRDLNIQIKAHNRLKKGGIFDGESSATMALPYELEDFILMKTVQPEISNELKLKIGYLSEWDNRELLFGLHITNPGLKEMLVKGSARHKLEYLYQGNISHILSNINKFNRRKVISQYRKMQLTYEKLGDYLVSEFLKLIISKVEQSDLEKIDAEGRRERLRESLMKVAIWVGIAIALSTTAVVTHLNSEAEKNVDKTPVILKDSDLGFLKSVSSFSINYAANGGGLRLTLSLNENEIDRNELEKLIIDLSNRGYVSVGGEAWDNSNSFETNINGLVKKINRGEEVYLYTDLDISVGE